MLPWYTSGKRQFSGEVFLVFWFLQLRYLKTCGVFETTNSDPKKTEKNHETKKTARNLAETTESNCSLLYIWENATACIISVKFSMFFIS
jgi:hypothetical protein